MPDKPSLLDKSSICRLVLSSLADTDILARVLAEYLKPGHSVALSGEMGAGKTTLVRAVVAALNGPESHVSSPSYSTQNEYRLPGGVRIEHWDLYRVRETPLELLEEEPSDTIRLIEWPERMTGTSVNENFFDLEISLLVEDSGDRIVVVEGGVAKAICNNLKVLCG
jgi:tRNA threonylcarbamoyl adenosine modification protein YjeE